MDELEEAEKPVSWSTTSISIQTPFWGGPRALHSRTESNKSSYWSWIPYVNSIFPYEETLLTLLERGHNWTNDDVIVEPKKKKKKKFGSPKGFFLVVAIYILGWYMRGTCLLAQPDDQFTQRVFLDTNYAIQFWDLDNWFEDVVNWTSRHFSDFTAPFPKTLKKSYSEVPSKDDELPTCDKRGERKTGLEKFFPLDSHSISIDETSGWVWTLIAFVQNCALFSQLTSPSGFLS